MSFIKSFINSIYDFEEYPNLIKNKFGSVFIHILALAVISHLMVCLTIYYFLSGYGGVTGVMQKIPQFSVSDGFLSTEYKKDETVNNGTKVIIDADKVYTLDEINKFSNAFIIDKEKISGVKNNIIQSAKYSEWGFDNLNNEKLLKSIPQIKVMLVCYLGAFYPFSALVQILSIVYIACIALLMAMILKKELRYFQIFKLCAYAATMPLLLRFILFAVNIFNPFKISMEMPYSVYVFMIFVYIFLALRKIENPKEETVSKAC